MQHIESGWKTNDGLQLYAQGWQPEDKPKAVVCLVHGLGEHSQRYAHVGEALCQAGYALFTYDLRGHGRSAGPRGHSPSYECMLDDITLLLAESATRYPDCRQFLYGHSLGGSLVLNYALRRRPAIKGVIATSPELCTTTPPPPFTLFLGKIMYRVWPSLTLKTGLAAAGLSHDQQVVQTYIADPLVHGVATAKFALDFLNAGQWALEHAAEFPLPLLLMHGGADPICSAPASQDFAARAGEKCTLKIWDGLYHETHNELEKAQVLAYMVEWLNSQPD